MDHGATQQEGDLLAIMSCENLLWSLSFINLLKITNVPSRKKLTTFMLLWFLRSLKLIIPASGKTPALLINVFL